MERYKGKSKYTPSWLNSSNTTNSSESRAFEEENINIKSENINKIGQSGNSDVDVHVDVFVDTTPIAFAILTSLLATKQMSTEEFDEALRRLNKLTKGSDFSISSFTPNNVSDVKFFNWNKRRVDEFPLFFINLLIL